jgi:hypothetical protein
MAESLSDGQSSADRGPMGQAPDPRGTVRAREETVLASLFDPPVDEMPTDKAWLEIILLNE